MSFAIGDTVRTATGRHYVIRTFYSSKRLGAAATLQPLKSGPHRSHRQARVSSLTLVQTRELSLAYHYAAESERAGAEEWQRERARRQAGRWLSLAEQRDADPRAALALGTDRILELEAVAS